jgi:hypothetical protein
VSLCPSGPVAMVVVEALVTIVKQRAAVVAAGSRSPYGKTQRERRRGEEQFVGPRYGVGTNGDRNERVRGTGQADEAASNRMPEFRSRLVSRQQALSSIEKNEHYPDQGAQEQQNLAGEGWKSSDLVRRRQDVSRLARPRTTPDRAQECRGRPCRAPG